MSYWQRWIMGWLEIAEGLIKVLTLGVVYPSPSWSFRYCLHATKSIAMRKIGRQVLAKQEELEEGRTYIDDIIDALDKL